MSRILLQELSAASGCSAASIKYYRREGLLPPGERLTATRQEYAPAHLERLQLIRVLREMAGAPIARIRRLTALLDDPEVPLIRSLEEAQAITLGADGESPDDAEERPEHPSVGVLLERLGWPDIDSLPRRALDRVLRSLEGWEMPADPDTLLNYARPMAEIAKGELAFVHSGSTPGDEPSPDAVVLRAVAGTIAFDRLVQVLRALAHTSLSVQASTAAEGSAAAPGRTES